MSLTAPATMPRLTVQSYPANRSVVANWTRTGTDIGLEVRAFHSKERREYFVSVSRYVEERVEGSYVSRKYAPMEDVKVSSRIPVARYSAKTLREAFDAVLTATTVDLDFWLAWADKITRHD